MTPTLNTGGRHSNLIFVKKHQRKRLSTFENFMRFYNSRLRIKDNHVLLIAKQRLYEVTLKIV